MTSVVIDDRVGGRSVPVPSAVPMSQWYMVSPGTMPTPCTPGVGPKLTQLPARLSSNTSLKINGLLNAVAPAA